MEINANGGFYARGVAYSMVKKMEVLQAYLNTTDDGDRFSMKKIDHVAKTTMVSTGYAHKVINEYLCTGALENPKRALNQLAVV